MAFSRWTATFRSRAIAGSGRAQYSSVTPRVRKPARPPQSGSSATSAPRPATSARDGPPAGAAGRPSRGLPRPAPAAGARPRARRGHPSGAFRRRCGLRPPVPRPRASEPSPPGGCGNKAPGPCRRRPVPIPGPTSDPRDRGRSRRGGQGHARRRPHPLRRRLHTRRQYRGVGDAPVRHPSVTALRVGRLMGSLGESLIPNRVESFPRPARSVSDGASTPRSRSGLGRTSPTRHEPTRFGISQQSLCRNRPIDARVRHATRIMEGATNPIWHKATARGP